LHLNIALDFYLSTLPVGSTLHTVAPRLKVVRHYNPFFFGSIINMERQDFVNKFMETDLQDIKRFVLEEVHAKSKIVQRKYLDSQMSLNFLFLAVILWLVSRLILVLS
jgi:hypothetical protein